MLNIPDEKKEIFYRRKLYFSKVDDLQVEWDLLIVLKESKTVINIEAKKGKNELERLSDASEQTSKRFDIFKKIFGYLLTPEWNYVKAVCLPNLKDYDVHHELAPCGNCNQFIIGNEQLEDMKPWLENFLSKKSISEAKEYDNLIAGIIGYMSLRKASEISTLIIDPIDYNMKTAEMLVADEKDLTGENDKVRRALVLENEIRTKYPAYSNDQILSELELRLKKENHLSYMLNPRQLDAVMKTSPYMIIDGDFGTGKTFVLKEKAKRCAEANKDKNIAFINLTSLLEKNTKLQHLENISVMDIMARIDFHQYDNIKVICCYDLAQHYKTAEEMQSTARYINIFALLESYLRHNKYDFIFIDELNNFVKKDEGVDFFQHCNSICVALKVTIYTVKQECPGKHITIN